MEADIGVMRLQAKELQELPAAVRSQEIGMGWILPRILQREPVLPTPWLQTSGL